MQDPSNPQTVYALFGGGGLWKTTNFYASITGNPGDTTWTPLTPDLPNNGGAISFGGSRSNIIYYGIGECRCPKHDAVCVCVWHC